jgi:hypothetical protein
VFENTLLRIIFGPKRDEITGERRKLRNGGFIICIHESDQIKENEVGRECGRHGRREKLVQSFGRKGRVKKYT